MSTLTRASGVRLNLPSQFQIADEPVAPPTLRRNLAKARLAPGATNSPDLLAAAFARQEMELVDQIGIVAGPTAKVRALAGPADLELDVPLAPHEDAAILLEQEGLYSWHFATATNPAAGVPASTNARRVPAVARQARFRIALTPSPSNETGHAARRGVIGDFIRGKVQAFIFRFAARVVVGQVLKFLERNARKGLVHIAGSDPTAWGLVTNVANLPLPTARPARVLLLVHGTFSSTVGAYAALPATQWGGAFLQAAQASYDVVLGFDHPTLSEDPLENATELLAALQAIPWALPPRFDVVAHSRGGLVVRSLLEQLLPLTDFPLQAERVIFVGVTNGGTLLASPANWQALVDLYTNLAMATCTLLGLLPQARVATTVLQELVRGLGAFVKYCATTAVTDRLVPGLAAMEPTGDFVRRLNEEQPHQPSIAQCYYCAVTSEFRPQVFGGTHEPREFPARVVAWLGSGFMQNLMREANDLVVNTAAMTQIDPALGNYLKDTLAFGPNPQVYHTNYFVQPQVANALTRWLRLAAPAPAALAPNKRGTSPTRATHQPAKARRLPEAPLRPGRFVEADLPAVVDLDVHVTSSDVSLQDAARAVQEAFPSYVVVRHFDRNEPRDFAFTAEDILGAAKRRPSATLEQAFRLKSLPPSAVYPAVAAAWGEPARRPNTPATHAVVRQQGRPVGVVPPVVGLPNGPALAKLVRRVQSPRKPEDFILKTRLMPTFAPAGSFGGLPGAGPLAGASRVLGGLLARNGDLAGPARRPAAVKSKPRAPAKPTPNSPPATCYFRAEMDQEVVVGRPTTVEVIISREVLNRALHAAAAEGPAPVAADAPLVVQVLPKINFETVTAGLEEQLVALPRAGEAQELYVTLRATHAGPGEVWVVVRQGQVPLLTLVLKPRVVEPGTVELGGRVQTAAAAAPLLAPAPAVNQLVIMERRNGAQVSYHFQLEMQGLAVMQWGEIQPFIGDRETYVANLYQNIESRWLSNPTDTRNFTAELRALGGELFDELIPTELQRLLWDYRTRITSILVIAEEPFIPWELVHLHAPGKGLGPKPCFLGQLGLVRWLHEAGWPRQDLRLRPGKCRYVIPHYPDARYELPEAEKEAEFLQQTLLAKAVSPTAEAVRNLLKRPGAFDLLHFACHGEANSANIAQAQLLLAGRMEQGQYVPEYLSATTAGQYANFGPHAPIIVLNACQAGRLGYKLTGVGGFAQAFLERGAGAFIGTLWSVGDQPARSFTETLYERLLAGDTLAAATTAARERARQAGDATWLVYAVYGHPYAKVGA